jgi:hypothetical protein
LSRPSACTLSHPRPVPNPRERSRSHLRSPVILGVRTCRTREPPRRSHEECVNINSSRFKHHKPGLNFSLCNVSPSFCVVKFDSPDPKSGRVFPERRNGNSYDFITIIKLRTNKPASSLIEATRFPPGSRHQQRSQPGHGRAATPTRPTAGCVCPRVEGGTPHPQPARPDAEAKLFLLRAGAHPEPKWRIGEDGKAACKANRPS